MEIANDGGRFVQMSLNLSKLASLSSFFNYFFIVFSHNMISDQSCLYRNKVLLRKRIEDDKMIRYVQMIEW